MQIWRYRMSLGTRSEELHGWPYTTVGELDGEYNMYYPPYYIYRLLLYKMTRTKCVFTSLTLSLCYNVDLHARGEVINGGFGLLLDGSEVRYYTSPFRRPRSSHFKICRMQLKGQR